MHLKGKYLVWAGVGKVFKIDFCKCIIVFLVPTVWGTLGLGWGQSPHFFSSVLTMYVTFAWRLSTETGWLLRSTPLPSHGWLMGDGSILKCTYQSRSFLWLQRNKKNNNQEERAGPPGLLSMFRKVCYLIQRTGFLLRTAWVTSFTWSALSECRLTHGYVPGQS